MNQGRYPEKVINEAVTLVKRMDSKDAADALREKYGYETLHPKTVARWARQYPLGKNNPLLPSKVAEEIRDVARGEAQMAIAGVGSVKEAEVRDIAKAEAQMVADLTLRTLMTPPRLDPIEERKFAEKIEKHWNGLARIITDLASLQVFPPDASEIRRRFAWPTESSWQVSQGQAYRESSGKVLVTLNLQEQEVWKLVRQHLEGHPILDAIEKWKQATANDLAARRSLFEALLRYVETNTGLSVWVGVNEDDIKADGIHNHYVDKLYDQVFRTVINVGPALAGHVGRPVPLTWDQFALNGEGNLCHYNDLLIRGGDETRREKAVTLLLDAHNRLSDIPQALGAGKVYQEADSQTGRVRAIRSDFLKSGLDPDSRCKECLPWFLALGIPSRGRWG